MEQELKYSWYHFVSIPSPVANEWNTRIFLIVCWNFCETHISCLNKIVSQRLYTARREKNKDQKKSIDIFRPLFERKNSWSHEKMPSDGTTMLVLKRIFVVCECLYLLVVILFCRMTYAASLKRLSLSMWVSGTKNKSDLGKIFLIFRMWIQNAPRNKQ